MLTNAPVRVRNLAINPVAQPKYQSFTQFVPMKEFETLGHGEARLACATKERLTQL